MPAALVAAEVVEPPPAAADEDELLLLPHAAIATAHRTTRTSEATPFGRLMDSSLLAFSPLR